jgi:hypothetical protein
MNTRQRTSGDATVTTVTSDAAVVTVVQVPALSAYGELLSK